MWNDHPFSQRRRTPERIMGKGFGGDREVMGVENIGKKGWCRQYRRGGGLHKIGG